MLKKALKAVRIERSEAESKYEWPAINYLARFDFAPVALRSARTENFNKLLMLFPKADAKVMETAVKNLFKVGVFPKNCMITDIGWKSNVELLKLTNPGVSAANVPFDKIADMSFCKKAIAASGS